MSASLSKRVNKSRTKLSKCENNLSGWDRAIADAKKGIKRLELTIDTFTERRDAGEPWLGDIAGTAKADVPA